MDIKKNIWWIVGVFAALAVGFWIGSQKKKNGLTSSTNGGTTTVTTRS